MPELLEDSIRATAPVPDDDFLTRLDARVESGFAKEKPKPRPGTAAAAARPRRRRLPWLLQPAGGLVAVVLLGVLVSFGTIAAVLGGGDDDESASSGSVPQMMSPTSDDAAQSSGGGASGSDAAGVAESAPAAPAPQGSEVAPGERRVVERSTSLALTTPEGRFADTTAGVLAVADRTGTIVVSSQVSQLDSGRDVATYDLRVPTSRLDETLAQLSRLGDVRRRSSTTDDITAAAVSARDRLTDARDRRAALLKALARADTDRERASIEQRLRSARRQIAAAEADVRTVAARGNRARVDLTVRSAKVEGGAWTPGDAADDAGAILQWIAGAVLVAGAVLLPLALVVAALVGTSRLTRRRRREAALG